MRVLLDECVFLTVDQNIAYQQNPADLPIAIVAMVATSNRLSDLRPLIPKVLKVLRSVKRGDLVRVGA